MKNQYLGDIGDFGKYALLRAFAGEGVRIGVNWYLTEDDGSNDGKFTDYLQKDVMCKYEPELFGRLKEITTNPQKSVLDIEQRGIIPYAIFYNAPLKPEGKPNDRKQERITWFRESLKRLKDCDLIFMDPDKGLQRRNNPAEKGVEQYILPDEVENYFNNGHNVVFYCHKGHRKDDDWWDYKDFMFERIKDAKPAVLTYHKGTQRSFIFLMHDKDFVKYRKIIDKFLRGWNKVFTEEFTSKGDVTGKANREPFVIKKNDGSEIAITIRADGKIQVNNSENKTLSCVYDTEYFCNLIWR